jgi:tyrosinase
MRQTAITSTRNTFLNPIPATRNVTVRKSVYDLGDPEVLALRQAFAALQSIGDNRGYQYVAGVHGLPQYYCPHGDPFFLIWHRPYVLMFEEALQAVSPGIALPFWDWTSDRAQTEGLPPIFAEETYAEPNTGNQLPNPLYKAAISYSNPNNWTETSRDPASPSSLADLATLVQSANREDNYNDFCPAVEQPHNGLHGWVGGSMGLVPYAAFDPIFWVHHCFIEKLFCDWQDRAQASLPTAIAGLAQAPFNKTTDDLWNYKALGYRYAPEGAELVPSMRPQMLAAATPLTSLAATFDLAKVPDDFEHAALNFVRRTYPRKSFEVRVFLGGPPANVNTPKRNNPNYAGSLYTFGHGGCTGDPGHCDVPVVPEGATYFTVLRPEHPLTPRRMTLDVTKTVRKAKSSATGPKLQVHIVLIDPKGKELPSDALDYEMLILDAV